MHITRSRRGAFQLRFHPFHLFPALGDIKHIKLRRRKRARAQPAANDDNSSIFFVVRVRRQGCAVPVSAGRRIACHHDGSVDTVAAAVVDIVRVVVPNASHMVRPDPPFVLNIVQKERIVILTAVIATKTVQIAVEMGHRMILDGGSWRTVSGADARLGPSHSLHLGYE